MQGAIICSQATLLFVLKREKWRGRKKKEETKETNGPISFLKRCFSSSFIKSRGRILFDWLITRSIHHWPTYPHQFDTAILDNLLRMTKRSLLPWLLFDLFNIRKLIFNLKQMYQILSQHLDEFCTLKSSLMPSFCDSYSPTLQSVSVSLSLFNGQICLMCQAEELSLSLARSRSLSVRFFCLFVSFSLPPCLLSPLSMCVVLWCQPTISDPFLRFTANFTPSSLRRFNPSIIPLFILPQFEAELSAFHRKTQMKLSHSGNFFASFFLNLVHRLLPYLNFLQYLPSCSSLLPFLITSSCLHLSPSSFSPSPVLLAGPPNRCGSLCGTNRPEAEGCLRPFRLITSHLCVHKQTNTAINLRAQYRLSGRGGGTGLGEKMRDTETDGGRVLCHLLSSMKQVMPSAMFCQCYIIRGSLTMCPRDQNWLLELMKCWVEFYSVKVI